MLKSRLNNLSNELSHAQFGRQKASKKVLQKALCTCQLVLCKELALHTWRMFCTEFCSGTTHIKCTTHLDEFTTHLVVGLQIVPKLIKFPQNSQIPPWQVSNIIFIAKRNYCISFWVVLILKTSNPNCH